MGYARKKKDAGDQNQREEGTKGKKGERVGKDEPGTGGSLINGWVTRTNV